jgi:uncharacterized membrane protein YhaH (DUF805 family)
MNLKNLFTSFDGRIGRMKWWYGLLAVMWIEAVVAFLGIKVFGTYLVADAPNERAQMITTLMILVVILFVLSLFPLYAKRWHDRGKSGWWTLIWLVPIIGNIWILIELGFLKGTEGPNQYGNDPLQDLDQ